MNSSTKAFRRSDVLREVRESSPLDLMMLGLKTMAMLAGVILLISDFSLTRMRNIMRYLRRILFPSGKCGRIDFSFVEAEKLSGKPVICFSEQEKVLAPPKRQVRRKRTGNRDEHVIIVIREKRFR